MNFKSDASIAGYKSSGAYVVTFHSALETIHILHIQHILEP